MSQIFISYYHANGFVVDELVKRIEKEGFVKALYSTK